MFQYIVKRLGISLLTVWILVTLVFFLVRILPGSPFENEKTSPEIVAAQMRYYGFDQPLTKQYAQYLKNLLHGDMGYSLIYQNQKVEDVIRDAFPQSASLGLRATVFALVAGVGLGAVSALRQNQPLDHLSMLIAIVGVSVPSFVIGCLVQYFFAVKLGWFPVARWESFSSTILPTVTLGLGTLAVIARLMRTSMLEIIGQDYMKTAKAKGLSRRQILFGHQLRNAILPVVTVLGPTVAALMTGSFVVEKLFAIPGLGRHYTMSIQNLDYTLTLGLTIFYGTFLIGMNFLVDLLYGLIDPRIRAYGGGK